MKQQPQPHPLMLSTQVKKAKAAPDLISSSIKGSFSDGTQYRSEQKTPLKNEDAHYSSKIDNGLISDESNQKQLFVPRMEVSNARVIDFY